MSPLAGRHALSASAESKRYILPSYMTPSLSNLMMVDSFVTLLGSFRGLSLLFPSSLPSLRRLHPSIGYFR